MKCNEIRNLVLAYLDSELDARTSQEIQLHLQSCAECAELFAREEKFNERLFGVLRVGQHTPALWEQIESRVRPSRRSAAAQIFNLLYRRIPFCGRSASPNAPKGFEVQPIANRRYSRLKICATGAVALALVGGLAWWVAPRLAAGPLDLAQAVEKDHREFLQGKVSPEFTGALPDEIASKLEGRLDAAAFNKVPAAGHFRSEGARLCHLEGVPVAWTLGRCNDVPVSLVVFNKSELNHFPEVRHRLNTGEPIVCTRTGRFQFAVRFSGDHVVCAIADTSRQMLEELLKAVPGPG